MKFTMPRSGSWPAALWLAFCVAAPLQGQGSDADLSSATLEDLTRMRVTVSSFARHSEDLRTTPAAVFVISSDQIAHSSASSIPDLLRMVPGVQVQQINASTWAVTARGFDNQYANKLLVLVDGRTIYTEIISGVLWDEIDLPLDEIDRIEVIRGPGAAVWGTNAVNGVVNILTRKPRGASGGQLAGEVSRVDEALKASYGGVLGSRSHFRAYSRYINRESLDQVDGSRSYDGESSFRAGGQMDFARGAADLLGFTGDLYLGHTRNQELPGSNLAIGVDGEDPGWLSGGHALGRWEHQYAHAASNLQGYYQEQSRHLIGTNIRTRTLDLDWSSELRTGSRQDLVWGAETRLTWDHIAGEVLPTLKPEYKNHLVAGFVQDQLTVVPHRLIATVGSKIQQGTLAGFQLEPSGRLLWSPDDHQSVWAAASRGAVAPSIQDIALNFKLLAGKQDGLPFETTLEGNPAYKPEIVVAYEAGYRREIARDLTLDVATFYNVNRRLTSLTATNTQLVLAPTPTIDTELLYTNAFGARTAGVEGELAWKPSSQVQLLAAYTWDQADVRQTGPGTASILDSWDVPRNSGSLTGWWEFRRPWVTGFFVNYNGALPSQPQTGVIANGAVPQYTRLDLHVGRSLHEHFSVDAGGSNLLTPRHWECPKGSNLVVSSEVPRSFFVRGQVSF